MTKIKSLALTALLLPLAALHAADNGDILLFSFFRDNGQAGIYLAASDDGLHFTPLNNDHPVVKPAPWVGQHLTRDPSMVYHDGIFHAVWTTGWKGNCFGYAESKDLVHWSQSVKVTPFPADKIPRNTWAPEICWDPLQKNFAIFWSSSFGDGQGNHIFVTRTADGKTFSEAKPFLDPGFACIDGMMVFDDSAADKRWVLVFKNEEPWQNGGKNLHLATAPPDFSQPWAIHPEPIIGPGTKVRPESMCEGPSLLKTKSGWNLYWDSPLINTYAMASSLDLTNWTDHTAELKLPDHPRHGTIFRTPRAAVGWLNNSPGDKKP